MPAPSDWRSRAGSDVSAAGIRVGMRLPVVAWTGCVALAGALPSGAAQAPSAQVRTVATINRKTGLDEDAEPRRGRRWGTAIDSRTLDADRSGSIGDRCAAIDEKAFVSL
jgi:hypothetical protein